MITRERVIELLDYNRDTGEFRHAVNRGTAKKGYLAGGIDSKGYRQIRLDGRLFLAHRLAWLIEFGKWPDDQLDHINGTTDDNRISNLRPCGYRENAQNHRIRNDNTSGHPGVSWCATNKRWIAHIQVGGRRVRRNFVDKDKAIEFRISAKAALHTFQPVQRDVLTRGNHSEAAA